VEVSVGSTAQRDVAPPGREAVVLQRGARTKAEAHRPALKDEDVERVDRIRDA
jgi:hypothetical protein